MRISDWSSDVCSSDLTGRRETCRKSVEVRASFSLRQLIEIRRVGAPLRPKVKDRDHERCGEQHGDQTGRGPADATAQLAGTRHCAGQGDAESGPGQSRKGVAEGKGGAVSVTLG